MIANAVDAEGWKEVQASPARRSASAVSAVCFLSGSFPPFHSHHLTAYYIEQPGTANTAWTQWTHTHTHTLYTSTRVRARTQARCNDDEIVC